jgi:hypothetical protein
VTSSKLSNRTRKARERRRASNAVTSAGVDLKLFQSGCYYEQDPSSTSECQPGITKDFFFEPIHGVSLVHRASVPSISISVSIRCIAVRQSKEKKLMENHAERPHVCLGVHLLNKAGLRGRKRFWGGIFKAGAY